MLWTQQFARAMPEPFINAPVCSNYTTVAAGRDETAMPIALPTPEDETVPAQRTYIYDEATEQLVSSKLLGIVFFQFGTCLVKL
jgi:hypothetical protein